jgi:hypothetical protein
LLAGPIQNPQTTRILRRIVPLFPFEQGVKLVEQFRLSTLPEIHNWGALIQAGEAFAAENL